MEINGLGHVDGAQPIRSPHRAEAIEPRTTTDSVFGADEIDISSEAEMISKINDLPEMRTDRVAEIRAEIDAGVYETSEKLDVAVGRLLDEIG